MCHVRETTEARMRAQVFFLSYGKNGVATDRHGNTERSRFPGRSGVLLQDVK